MMIAPKDRLTILIKTKIDGEWETDVHQVLALIYNDDETIDSLFCCSGQLMTAKQILRESEEANLEVMIRYITYN